MGSNVKFQQGVLVSLIIPAHNAQDFVCRALSSAQSQDFDEFEIIVINDGSTDLTGELIRSMSATDNRVVVVDTPNRGVSSARNIGLRYAHGQIIMFLDADDEIEPDYIPSAVQALKVTGADICILPAENCNGDLTLYEANKPLPAERILRDALMGRIALPVWRLALASQLLDRYGISFSEDVPMGEDQEFSLKSLSVAHSVVVTNHSYYHYNINNKMSATKQFDKNQFSYVVAMRRAAEFAKNRLDTNRYSALEPYFDKKIIEALLYACEQCLSSSSVGTVAQWMKPYRSYIGSVHACRSLLTNKETVFASLLFICEYLAALFIHLLTLRGHDS